MQTLILSRFVNVETQYKIDWHQIVRKDENRWEWIVVVIRVVWFIGDANNRLWQSIIDKNSSFNKKTYVKSAVQFLFHYNNFPKYSLIWYFKYLLLWQQWTATIRLIVIFSNCHPQSVIPSNQMLLPDVIAINQSPHPTHLVQFTYTSQTITDICFPMALQHPVGQSLFNVEASRSYSDTPQSVGILWMSDQLITETCPWQQVKHTEETDRHAYRGILNRSFRRWAATQPLHRSGGHWVRPLRVIQCSITYCKDIWILNWGVTRCVWLYDFRLFEITILLIKVRKCVTGCTKL
jgi:hypothetical protein